MPEVTRLDDKHVGHASPTPNPFHQTAYVGGSDNVFANGKNVMRANQDSTSCGDPATGGSGTVFVNNKPVHRKGDATGGHGSWVPNSSAEGSPDVFAGD
tara:strand:+ start:37710 stop:38006 length:297 start_codon:yes stop_codon:yes gene_type:complete